MLTNKTINLSKTLTLVALAGAASASVQAEQWRGWNIHPPSYPNSMALESFAEEVAENTDGRIEPKVYHNGVLGDQPDAIEQTRNGALNFANFNMGPMGRAGDEHPLAAVHLPEPG